MKSNNKKDIMNLWQSIWFCFKLLVKPKQAINSDEMFKCHYFTTFVFAIAFILFPYFKVGDGLPIFIIIALVTELMLRYVFVLVLKLSLFIANIRKSNCEYKMLFDKKFLYRFYIPCSTMIHIVPLLTATLTLVFGNPNVAMQIILAIINCLSIIFIYFCLSCNFKIEKKKLALVAILQLVILFLFDKGMDILINYVKTITT